VLTNMMTREQVHEAIDRLDEGQLDEVRTVLEKISATDPRERWRRIPGLQMPDRWPPDFGDFQPLKLDGEPVSEQLIRDRR